MPNPWFATATAAVLFLSPRPSAGSVLNFDMTFETLKMESLSEGPMYSTLDSPFKQPGKRSEIALLIDWFPERASDPHAVSVLFTSNASLTKAGGLPRDVILCEKDLKTASYESYVFSAPGTIDVSYEITTTSSATNFPRALIFVCPCVQPTAENGLTQNDPQRCWSHGNKKGVQFHGQATFANAFGFLSAEALPLLPFFAGLSAAHFVLLSVYIAACFYFRQHLTLLHFAVATLAAVGMLESALYTILCVAAGKLSLSLSLSLYVPPPCLCSPVHSTPPHTDTCGRT